ncbi:hypothetical protein [Pedobacter chitinilyticus]|uniref:Uncharacterized protein n=1 Tax=Pedobacter chitinilyticus TaxID=2233776 RepID=A0A443YW85_9SPHI|nr:hypothetical protein [Pedobacter chitinilyticus]RWU08233.1 hypothetical protein DPV69_07595 [Pedobacter chitinilyticus]
MKRLFLQLVAVVLLLSCLSCSKDIVENKKTLDKLYEVYKNGQISICKYNGQTVYSAMQNVYDSPEVIYDKNGNPIGNCNYAWGQVDAMCKEVTNCKIIYMVKDNIWGQSATNVFKLGK